MSYKKINETKVYKLAFELAMKVLEISKRFPKEETYSLTDQVRRSGRSVCSCLAEASRKRLYEAHFVPKVSDAIWKMQKHKLGWHLLSLANT
jgi:four helix bundle protein